MAESRFAEVAIDRIARRPAQPRRHFDPDALDELREAIRTQRVIEPVVLRTTANGHEVVAGEQRWRAAQIAGLHEISAVKSINVDRFRG